MRLAGKVIILTGAREGIGRAVAVGYAKEGAKLVATSRNIGPDSEVIQEVKAVGGEVLPVKADVAIPEDVDRLVKAAVDTFGRLDVMVNNAGFTKPALLYKMTDEQWDAVIAVHLKGTFNCIRAAARVMMEQKSGTIINVTSSAGLVGTIGQINYSAAKGGIVAMTKSAARELARFNINVNAIAPFAVTGMSEKIATDPELSQKYLARIPLGRFGTVDEMVPAFVFLASDESKYVTGQVLCVDGGLVM